MKTGYLWIAAWLVFYALGFRTDMQKLFANRGLHIIGKEYYRLFTGLLLHVNLFHLAVNAAGMYFVTGFLSGQTEGWKLTVFTVLSGTLANLLFSAFYPESTSIGGSPVVFSLLGLLLAFQLLRPELPRFQTGTVYASWILGIAVLGNIPIFSKNLSTLVIHLMAFGCGFLFSAAGTWAGMF